MDPRYRATLWRKALERKGWRRISSMRIPKCVIEFHVIQDGYLYSGRCGTFSFDDNDIRQPGTVAYVLKRRDRIIEGVWRRARDQSAEWGMTRRPWR